MTSPANYWLELAVKAEPEAVEPITELFSRYGYNQGVVIEEAVTPGPDGGVEIDFTAPVTIRTYLPVTPEAEPDRESDGLSRDERIQKLREGLWHLGRMLHIEDLEVSQKREEDWANAWKEYYQVHRVGRRTVIKPPWQDYEPLPDDIVVEIDPGMAFGTGLHPTTRLCLLFLEETLSQNQKIKALDIGTGSGILAIAAARLGAETVVGVDTDPVAIRAAAENVERNGLTGQVILATGSLAVEQGGTIHGGFYSFPEEAQQTPPELSEYLPYNLIIANIIARILIFLAPAMALALTPGGGIIASGIISEKVAGVIEAFEAAGLKIVEQRNEGDWVALYARKS